MTAVTFPLRPPRLAFAICGWRWQNDVHEIKYSADCTAVVQHKVIHVHYIPRSTYMSPVPIHTYN